MGYCMDMTGCDFLLKAENKDEALKYAKNKLISEVEEKGGGGSFGGGKKKKVWYAWVDTQDLEDAKSVEDLIIAFGWHYELAENGDIDRLYFSMDKIGQEILLFQALAPFAEEGSYIQMSGEDGTIWRWVFRNKECKEVTATISFDE